MVISQLSIVKKKTGNQNRNLHFLLSTFDVGPIYSFIFLSSFLFVYFQHEILRLHICGQSCEFMQKRRTGSVF